VGDAEVERTWTTRKYNFHQTQNRLEDLTLEKKKNIKWGVTFM
jgi:hypothetical protein